MNAAGSTIQRLPQANLSAGTQYLPIANVIGQGGLSLASSSITVIGDTNPAIFSASPVGLKYGVVFRVPAGASGNSDVTLCATDASGASVEAVVNVAVGGGLAGLDGATLPASLLSGGSVPLDGPPLPLWMARGATGDSPISSPANNDTASPTSNSQSAGAGGGTTTADSALTGGISTVNHSGVSTADDSTDDVDGITGCRGGCYDSFDWYFWGCGCGCGCSSGTVPVAGTGCNTGITLDANPTQVTSGQPVDLWTIVYPERDPENYPAFLPDDEVEYAYLGSNSYDPNWTSPSKLCWADITQNSPYYPPTADITITSLPVGIDPIQVGYPGSGADCVFGNYGGRDDADYDYDAAVSNVVNVEVDPIVSIANAPSVMVAGQLVTLGSTVTDANTDDLSSFASYSWSVSGGPTATASTDGPTLAFQPTAGGTYTITLSATVNGATGTARQDINVSSVFITEADAQPTGEPGIPSNTVLGGDPANFQISISPAVTYPVTVYYSTFDGTAKEGYEYDATKASVTIPGNAGPSSGTFSIQTIDDYADISGTYFKVGITKIGTDTDPLDAVWYSGPSATANLVPYHNYCAACCGTGVAQDGSLTLADPSSLSGTGTGAMDNGSLGVQVIPAISLVLADEAVAVQGFGQAEIFDYGGGGYSARNGSGDTLTFVSNYSAAVSSDFSSDVSSDFSSGESVFVFTSASDGTQYNFDSGGGLMSETSAAGVSDTYKNGSQDTLNVTFSNPASSSAANQQLTFTPVGQAASGLFELSVGGTSTTPIYYNIASAPNTAFNIRQALVTAGFPGTTVAGSSNGSSFVFSVNFENSESPIHFAAFTGKLNSITSPVSTGGDQLVTQTLDSNGNVVQVNETNVQSDGATPVATVGSSDYTYYQSGANGGAAGQLEMVTTSDANGNVTDTTYYRYYTPQDVSNGETGAYVGSVEFVFTTASVARLEAAFPTATNLDALTDAQVKQYADNYFQYYTSTAPNPALVGRVSEEVAGGVATSYGYAFNPADSSDPNAWATERIQTQSTGTTTTTTTTFDNSAGQEMLSDVWNGVTGSALQHSITYNLYDANGNLIETAHPSAIYTNYSYTDPSNPVYLNYVEYGYNSSWNNLYVHLNPTTGLIDVNTYYPTNPSPPATTSTPGGVAGWAWKTAEAQGSVQAGTAIGVTGGPILQTFTDYIAATGSNGTSYYTNSTTQYQNADGTGAETTSYQYQFNTSGAMPYIVSETTLSSPVLAAQHGADSSQAVSSATAGTPGSVVTPVTVVTTLTNSYSVGDWVQLSNSSTASQWYRIVGVTNNYTFTIDVPTGTVLPASPLTVQSREGSQDVYNTYGQVVWSQDAAGSISYSQYDPATGAVTEQIQDANVNSNNSSAYGSDWALLPPAWQTSGANAKNLITQYVVDSQGRTLLQIDPAGNATATFYDEANHITKTYPGWSNWTNATGHSVVGTIQLSQSDLSGTYSSTDNTPTSFDQSVSYGWKTAYLTAAPYTFNGTTYYLPDGSDSPGSSDAVIQSLSRDILNSSGQVTRSLEYFSMSGVSYSTTYAALGTKGVNYLETDTYYDPLGRAISTHNPDGTVDETVYDAQGNVTQQWKGNNDVPTSNLNGDGPIDPRDFQWWVAHNSGAKSATAYGLNMYLVTANSYLCSCQPAGTDFVGPACRRGSRGTGRFSFAHSAMAA